MGFHYLTAIGLPISFLAKLGDLGSKFKVSLGQEEHLSASVQAKQSQIQMSGKFRGESKRNFFL